MMGVEAGLLNETGTTTGGEEDGGEMAEGVEDMEVGVSIKGVLLSLLLILVLIMFVGAEEVVG